VLGLVAACCLVLAAANIEENDIHTLEDSAQELVALDSGKVVVKKTYKCNKKVVPTCKGCIGTCYTYTDTTTTTTKDVVKPVSRPKCANEVSTAKVACTNKLATYKKMQASKCLQKEMAAVMSRIKRNQEKTVKQQAALKSAEETLRKLRYGEHNAASKAQAAREKLVKTVVKEITQKNGLKHFTNKAMNELKDEKSTRYKANKATHAAVKLAETQPDQAPVNAKASEAKSLYARMVEEKIKLARDKYAKNKGKKNEKVTEEMIKKLFEKAKKARAQEIEDAKKMKSLTKKVAHQNTKLTKDETKTAKLEEEASKKEIKSFGKKAKKQQKVLSKDQKKLKAAKKKLDHAKKEAAATGKEVQKLNNMNLKSVLKSAKTLLKKP